MPIDNLDRSIIRRLMENGRLSNKVMAYELGVSEPTIAARIRALVDNDVIRIVAQRSIHDSTDAGVSALIEFQLKSGLSIDAIRRVVAEIPEIFTAYETSGRPEVIANCQARSMADLNRIIGLLYQLEGKAQITTFPILDLVQFRIAFFAPDLDRVARIKSGTTANKLTALLEIDGRQTIRTLASKLSLSETSTRYQLQKLLAAPGFKIGAVCDPFALGLPCWTDIRIVANSNSVKKIIDDMRHMEDVYILAHLAGTNNIAVFIVTATLSQADHFVEHQVKRASGVQSFSATRVLRSLKYDYTFHM